MTRMPPDSSVTPPVTAAEQGSKPMRLRRFLLVFVVVAIAALVGMTLLPHDKYLRYQALNDRSSPRAYWVYERIHSDPTRSEEHTSELQSPCNLVCRLLLEKKKTLNIL